MRFSDRCMNMGDQHTRRWCSNCWSSISATSDTRVFLGSSSAVPYQRDSKPNRIMRAVGIAFGSMVGSVSQLILSPSGLLPAHVLSGSAPIPWMATMLQIVSDLWLAGGKWLTYSTASAFSSMSLGSCPIGSIKILIPETAIAQPRHPT